LAGSCECGDEPSGSGATELSDDQEVISAVVNGEPDMGSVNEIDLEIEILANYAHCSSGGYLNPLHVLVAENSDSFKAGKG
jgi:hypothetical protein